MINAILYAIRSSAAQVCLFAMLAVYLVPATAFALQEEILVPEPGKPPEDTAWQGYIIGFVLFALIIFLSMRPVKRSHQD